KLRRSIAIDGPRGIVLKGGGDEFPRRLRGVDIADPRLRVSFKFPKRHADTMPVRLPHPLIAAHKRGKRYRLRRGKRRIPSRPMLHTRDLFAKLTFVGFGRLMTHELRFGLRMLAFAQPRKMYGTDRAVQAPLLGELALPFAVALLVAAPIVLLLRGKLPRMVCSRLTGGQRFRDRKHKRSSTVRGTVLAPTVNAARTCSRQFACHSILFASFEVNRSLGLASAAAMVEPKSGSTGWIGFFNDSA